MSFPNFPHRSTVPLQYVVCNKKDDVWECDICHTCNKNIMKKMECANEIFQIPSFYPKWMINLICRWKLSPKITFR